MLAKIIRLIRSNYKKFTLSGEDYLRSLGGTVGLQCRVLTSTFGSEPWLIKIGNNTTITSGVKLLTHDGATWLIRDKKGRRYSFNEIKIGSNVFIGVNSIVMPGVTIEDNVIVAAGSVITKSVPSGYIVGGNPARVIGLYADYEKKALQSFVTDKEMNKKISLKSRIDAVIDIQRKPFMKKPNE